MVTKGRQNHRVPTRVPVVLEGERGHKLGILQGEGTGGNHFSKLKGRQEKKPKDQRCIHHKSLRQIVAHHRKGEAHAIEKRGASRTKEREVLEEKRGSAKLKGKRNYVANPI